MSKKIWFLTILISGLCLGSAVQAASGTNTVDVMSCENTATGIRIKRASGEPYILTNGCRNAGYGLRDYYMTCTANTQYRVEWTENCKAGSDIEAPTVWIYANKNTYKSGEKVYLTARADDNKKVTKIEVYRGNRLLKTCRNASFCGFVDKAKVNDSGYRAKAYDSAGNVGVSEWYYVMVSDTSDKVLPIVDIAASKTVFTNENIYITAMASDNVGVSKVEIYRQGVKVKTCTDNDCQYVVNTRGMRDGQYSFFARAFDAVGNVGRSNTVTVSVDNFVDTTGPAVTMTGKIDGAGHYSIAVTVRDTESKIARAELYVDNSAVSGGIWSDSNYNGQELKYNFTGSVYSFGTHKFILKAKDARGNWTTSGALYLDYVDNNTNPSIDSAVRYYDTNNVGQLEFSAHATDDRGVSAIEIYLGPNNSENGMFLAHRCEYGANDRDASCSVVFPVALYRQGYFYAKVWDSDGRAATTQIKSYNY